MTRVGFVIEPPDAGWLGGSNYLRNLVTSLRREDVGVEPVAIGPLSGSGLEASANIREIRSRLFDRRSLVRPARIVVRELIGRDVAAELVLRKHGVRVLSHSGVIGANSSIPSINWVPDLQHRHLPAFFEPRTLQARDRQFDRTCRGSDLVITSSECAKRDLESFFPAARGKVRVLRFVVAAAAETEATPRDVLEGRYQFSGPFFFVPNQFWAHKNHGVLIGALRILRSRGQGVLVLATGSTVDHRRPDYFRDLMRKRSEAGVETTFRTLGMVPYEDVAGLARNAIALINPSLFEGWSTSVEESKSLGKAILLSDIDVHREQSPERGAYFAPNDAEALADLMWRAWTQFDPVEEARAMAVAREQLPARRRGFAQAYADIVAEVIRRR